MAKWDQIVVTVNREWVSDEIFAKGQDGYELVAVAPDRFDTIVDADGKTQQITLDYSLFFKRPWTGQ